MAVFRIKPTSHHKACSTVIHLTCLIALAGFVLLPIIQGDGGATSANAPPNVSTIVARPPERKSGSDAAPAALTFTVTTTADTGSGSLRDAITSANAGGGTVNFDIGGPAPHVIGLATALPAITQPVVIDGTSNPDFTGFPVIELNGIAVASGDGIAVSSSNCTIKGLAIYGFNGNGAVVNGSSNLIQGNLIGTNHFGAGTPNHGNGLVIAGTGNIVGSQGLPVGTASNTIAFNTGDGIRVIAGIQNQIISNSIFSNGGLGINLLSLANNSQSAPTLISAISSLGTTTVKGQVNGPPNSQMRIEFFSNQACGASGSGEGQILIGFITQNTNGGGSLSFTTSLALATHPGQTVTATATDAAGNSSAFSVCMVILSSASLTGTADLGVALVATPNPAVTGTSIIETILVTNTGPGPASDVTVTDNLPLSLIPLNCTTTLGTCGGSGNLVSVALGSLAAGANAVITITAQVSCSVSDGVSIGNTAVVFSSSTADPNPANNLATATIVASNPAPKIICPGNIVQASDPGSCGAIVKFPNPVVTDNCANAKVVCTPASGSLFPAGTTTVTCVATDLGGATATCTFTVTVKNIQGITLICPGNMVVNAPPGQCAPIVTYQTPLVVDTCPGAAVTCTPPSGSSFPVGVTTVMCNAVDLGGATATCTFTVTVVGIPQASVSLEGGGASLQFGPAAARRKSKGLNKRPSRIFTVQNTGCGPLVLTLQSVLRTGSDVNQGKIGDSDDRNLYSVAQLNNDGSQIPLDLFSNVTVAAGQGSNFRVFFNPLIPAVAPSRTQLSADQVLPDTVTSEITFRANFGPPVVVNLEGEVSSAIQLINPDAPRNPPVVTLTRSGDEFEVQYSVFDASMDVDHAVYQFFDSGGHQVGKALTADLSQLIQQSNFVRGQSFTLIQKFTGAEDHHEVATVMVTVFDSKTSDSVMSSGISVQGSAVTGRVLRRFGEPTIWLPPIGLGAPVPR